MKTDQSNRDQEAIERPTCKLLGWLGPTCCRSKRLVFWAQHDVPTFAGLLAGLLTQQSTERVLRSDEGTNARCLFGKGIEKAWRRESMSIVQYLFLCYLYRTLASFQGFSRSPTDYIPYTSEELGRAEHLRQFPLLGRPRGRTVGKSTHRDEVQHLCS